MVSFASVKKINNGFLVIYSVPGPEDDWSERQKEHFCKSLAQVNQALKQLFPKDAKEV